MTSINEIYIIETIFTILKKDDDTKSFISNDMCLSDDFFKFIEMTKLRLQFIVLLNCFFFSLEEFLQQTLNDYEYRLI